MNTREIQKSIKEVLETRQSGYLFHRESRTVEFKESFNHAAWSEYLVDFAAFANNIGGLLIFGVTNSPRKPVGLKKKNLEMFSQVDEGFISGEINKLFSPSINWSKRLVEHKGKQFGIFIIEEAEEKPVIAKQTEGKIKSGEVYYRYAGRTQKIEYAELSSIIQKRIETTNNNWQALIAKIGKIGPTNAAILDTKKGVIEKNKDNILVLDEKLLDQIQFVKEGNFSAKKGATALKIVGNITPINAVEVVKIEKKNLIEQYPYAYRELEDEVRRMLPGVKQTSIYQVMKENDMKDDARYSAYNFRSKTHEEKYKGTGKLASATPSIYNQAAVDLIIKILKNYDK